MKGLGAIHEELQWRTSRAYLHWRIRRRQQQGQACKELCRRVPDLSYDQASTVINDLVGSAVGKEATDRTVAEWLEANRERLEACIEEQREDAAERQIFELFSSLPAAKQADIARDLVGFTRVSKIGARAMGK